MRNLLALVGLVIVGFVGLGWYLDWYKFSTEKAPDGHRTVGVDVDATKVKEDLNKAKEKVKGALNKDPLPSPPPGSTIPLPGGSVPTSFSLPPPGSGDTVVFPTIEFPAPPSLPSVPPLPPPPLPK